MPDHTALSSAHHLVRPLDERVLALLAADGGAAISNSAVIDLGEQLIVWDSGLTPQAARALRRLANQYFGREPDLLINSHYHNDHIWGNQVFADLPRVSSARTRELIRSNGREEYEWTRDHVAAELASWQARNPTEPAEQRQRANFIAYYEGLVEAMPTLQVVTPTITFDQRLTLHGNALHAELISFERVHSPHDTVLFIPDRQLVCTGDILFVETHPFIAEGDVQHVLQALDTLAGWSVTTFIPGHGPVGTRADLDRLRGYLEHLLERVARGDTSSPMPAAYRDWALPDFYTMNLKALQPR